MKYAHRNIITLKWQQIRSDRQRYVASFIVSFFKYIYKRKNSYFFQINPCACCLQHHLFVPRHTETSVTPRGGHGWHRGVTCGASGADVAKKRRKKPILMIFVSFSCMEGVGGRCARFSPTIPRSYSPPPPTPNEPPSLVDSQIRYLLNSFFFVLLSFVESQSKYRPELKSGLKSKKPDNMCERT